MQYRPGKPKVTISTQDMPAAIPYLLGYHPSPGSIAFVGVDDRSVAFVSNIDASVTPDAAWSDAFVDIGELAGRHGWQVAFVAYGGLPAVGAHVRELTAALADMGVAVLEAVRLDDGQLYCLQCTDCGRDGVPVVPAAALIDALTAAGLSAASDRNAFTQQLAPIDAEHQQRMDAALDAAADRLGTLLGDYRANAQRAWQTLTDAGIAAIDDAMAAARNGVALTDDQAALLLIMLRHLPARDRALRATLDTPSLDLWRDLLRRAPDGLKAQAACLVAVAAQLDGQNHLARLALQLGQSDDPDYPLTDLLLQALLAGMSAGELRAILRASQDDSAQPPHDDSPSR